MSATDPRTHVDNQTYDINLKAHHEFDAFQFNSLTSFQRNASTQVLDDTDGLAFSKVTGLPPSFFNVPGADLADINLRENQYVQEFRLSSLADSRIAWTAGVNYFRSELQSDRDGHAVTPAFISTNGVQNNAITTNSYAAFGEVTVPVVDRLSATFGLRATHEDNSAAYRFSGNSLPGVVPSFNQDASLSDNFVTGRAMLSYQWTPDLMTYASIGRGEVSAGLPAFTVNSASGKPDQPFPASTSWTYETGFKSTLLSDRLMLNGALFFNDVDKGHLIVFNPSQALFTTAALDYQTYDGELEATAKVTSDFDVFAGLGYTHAELVNIPAASATGATSGNNVPNVPAVTANLGMEYRWSAHPLGLPGGFADRVVYQHVGSRAADVANSFNLAAYDIVNLKLSWENNGVSVYAFANNVTDDRYQSWGQIFGTVPTVRVGQGRILGVGTSFKF